MPLLATNKTAGNKTLAAPLPTPPVLPALATVDLTEDLRGNTSQDWEDIMMADVETGDVVFTWDGIVEYETGVMTTVGSPPGAHADSHLYSSSDPVTSAPMKPDADGLSQLPVIRKVLSAGAGGAPDDVLIYNADAPYGFRVLDCMLIVSAAVGGATVTLRSASGGGGSALSDAFDAAFTGVKRNASITGSGSIAKGGTLAVRRSDSAVAGEIVILLQRT